MMQPADHRQRDHFAFTDRLALAWLRSVLVEREVGSGAVIVVDVLAQDAPQMLLSEDNDVVQAFPAKGPDHALAVGICHGDRGAVRTCSIPIARTRRTKAAP